MHHLPPNGTDVSYSPMPGFYFSIILLTYYVTVHLAGLKTKQQFSLYLFTILQVKIKANENLPSVQPLVFLFSRVPWSAWKGQPVAMSVLNCRPQHLFLLLNTYQCNRRNGQQTLQLAGIWSLGPSLLTLSTSRMITIIPARFSLNYKKLNGLRFIIVFRFIKTNASQLPISHFPTYILHQ